MIDKDGYEVYFERRRYGNTTYTWAYLTDGVSSSIELGDPYPAVRFPKKELDERVRRALEEIRRREAGLREVHLRIYCPYGIRHLAELVEKVGLPGEVGESQPYEAVVSAKDYRRLREYCKGQRERFYIEARDGSAREEEESA